MLNLFGELLITYRQGILNEVSNIVEVTGFGRGIEKFTIINDYRLSDPLFGVNGTAVTFTALF